MSQTSDVSVDVVETFDSEELKEEMERSYLKTEDILVRYSSDVSKLKDENKLLKDSLSSSKNDVVELNEKLTSSQSEVQSLKKDNADLAKKIKKLVKKSGDDEAMIKEDLKNFESQLKEMEDIIHERDKTIAQNQKYNDKQNGEIANLNHTIDQLKKDLKEANRMRQSFEDEAKRSKNELRAQVERLRNNMSNMLQQGDQESKVLENQNQFLFNDLRQAQDEKDALQTANTHMSQEMSSLREELSKSQDESKNLLKQLHQFRDETSHDVEKVRLQTLELDKRNSKVKVLQKEFDEVKEQLTDEVEQKSNEISKVLTC